MPSFSRFLRDIMNSRIIAGLLVLASIIFGALTFATFTGFSSWLAHPERVVILIYFALAFLFIFGLFVAYRLAVFWKNRRSLRTGSRLHLQFMVMFAAVSAFPTLIITVFTIIFFNLGLESWFSDRVRTVVLNSKTIAQAYLNESRQNIQEDILRIARDLSRDAIMYESNDKRLARALQVFCEIRGISDAVIFEPEGQTLARIGVIFSVNFNPDFNELPTKLLDVAKGGDVVITSDGVGDQVYGIVKLDGFYNAYLMIANAIDPTALSYSDDTERAVRQFENLEQQRTNIQIGFILAFSGVALLLLLAAIWVGLNFASRLSSPIANLIVATKKIRDGDLEAPIPDQNLNNEIGVLSRAFKRMSEQLSKQHYALVQSNSQLDERRRFTETVLAGVSAGVIGLDRNGCIELPNRRASELLGVDLAQKMGVLLEEIVPELAVFLQKRPTVQPHQFLEYQIELKRNGTERLLLIKLGAEFITREIQGFVVTIDDITALLNAQKKAAWSDVARRIAHEIKNPLTPIQLSAERLKRRYTEKIEVGKNREIFETCTDTIIRQVGNLGQMVDEFSNFARMPVAVMQIENLTEICHQAMFLQKKS